MNTTLIGKLLVFLIVATSVMFAGMALGLYTNRINWAGAAGSGPGEAPGELAKRQEEVKHLREALERGRSRWSQALYSPGDPKNANQVPGLVTLERARATLKNWYAAQLQLPKTGKDAAGNQVADPVKPLLYKDGYLQRDKDGYPAFGDKLDLTYQEDYVRQLDQTENDIKAEIAAVKQKQDDLAKLTDEIKGVRVLLEEEALAQRNSLAELKYLEPFLYNGEVESQLLLKRQRSLQARLDELTKSQGASARQP
jgi:hypothetical protein